MAGGNVRIVCSLTGITLLYLFLFPVPSEMAGFWIGCSSGNFQPTNTCQRTCRMLGNLTSCCYGVNYSGRSACGCCANVTICPGNCESYCSMVSINMDSCAGANIMGELRDKAFGDISIDNFLFPGPELIPIVPVSTLTLVAPLQQQGIQQHEKKET